MIKGIPLYVLIDPGATDSFISVPTLEKCGLAAQVQNDFAQVEMALGRRQTVGLVVKNCIMKLGGMVTKVKLYSTTLGAYDVIIGMDWLESHRARVDYFEKKVYCNDDFGNPTTIEGLHRDVSL